MTETRAGTDQTYKGWTISQTWSGYSASSPGGLFIARAPTLERMRREIDLWEPQS